MGLIMAILLGVAISGIILLWQRYPILGLIVGTSMFVTLLTAIFVGTTIPFIMDFLGFDPALALGFLHNYNYRYYRTFYIFLYGFNYD